MVLCFAEPLPFMAKSRQCVVNTFGLLLPVDDFVEELRQDAVDFIPVLVLRSLSDRVALFIWPVHYRCRYVFEPGHHQSSEALNCSIISPAIIYVIILYVPALILGMISIIRKRKLTVEFVRRERKRAFLVFGISLLSLVGAYVQDSGYELKSDLYPLNVCYNVGLAFQRTALTQDYHRTSKDFTFHARPTHPEGKREVYVMVIGETSRALNWQLYGYERETNPLLSRQTGLIAFPKVLTESNTTHKSVPMLMSDATACNYDSIYHQKGIITAFKEAGFRTAFFSNQRYNHSFIDFFGMEADTYDFIKEDSVSSTYNPSDDELLKLVEEELAKGATKQFIVLHTYGSHFNYRERYPSEDAFFTPDYPMEAERKYRDNLVNAYDNSIRYTDDFLSRLIRMLEKQQVDAAMLYTSDHGEDIFDDSRHLFLHASPVPSYYQLHIAVSDFGCPMTTAKRIPNVGIPLLKIRIRMFLPAALSSRPCCL